MSKRKNRNGKQAMNAKRQRLIAYHEAGHAVIARVLGIDVCQVTILPIVPGSIASVTHKGVLLLAVNSDADTPVLLAAMEKHAKVSLAGPIAELTHRRIKTQRSKDWSEDERHIFLYVLMMVMLRRDGIKLASEHCAALDATLDAAFDAAFRRALFEYTPGTAGRAEFNEIMGRLNGEVDTLVAANWQAIKRVANALLDCPVLQQDDLDALISGTYDAEKARFKGMLDLATSSEATKHVEQHDDEVEPPHRLA